MPPSTPPHLDVSRTDPADLDLATADTLATIDNAALDGVPLRHHTAETFLLECRDRNGEGPDQAIWLARVGGDVVGWAGLSFYRYGPQDRAKIVGAVHPDHRRRGVGRALVETAEAATDRPKLRAPAWGGTGGEAAVPRLGYTRHGSHEVRRLTIADPQPVELVAAAEEASSDYDIERYAGPVPDELLGDMQLLREAINDAPGVDVLDEYPPERIRGYEQSLARQRNTPYTVIARHRASGEPAGITMLCVHELRPEIAAQEDTSVLAAHRGHRLGLRLKLAMLDWMRSERPDVEHADTWNVPGNAPMIAINEALGCRRVAETISFRKQR
jgi:GNAT superfamily N-acetyltransferase